MISPDLHQWGASLRAELTARLGESDAKLVIDSAVQISQSILKELPPLMALEVITLIGRIVNEQRRQDKSILNSGNN